MWAKDDNKAENSVSIINGVWEEVIVVGTGDKTEVSGLPSQRPKKPQSLPPCINTPVPLDLRKSLQGDYSHQAIRLEVKNTTKEIPRSLGCDVHCAFSFQNLADLACLCFPARTCVGSFTQQGKKKDLMVIEVASCMPALGWHFTFFTSLHISPTHFYFFRLYMSVTICRVEKFQGRKPMVWSGQTRRFGRTGALFWVSVQSAWPREGARQVLPELIDIIIPPSFPRKLGHPLQKQVLLTAKHLWLSG